MPKVSVIIPTYNREDCIGKAIESVLNQTYMDFELIIVNDGSIDNTEEVVKKFIDERIKYIKFKKNKGGSAARNVGIKAAKGEYIAFLDSDDEWLPKKVEKQVAKFQALPNNFGVVYSGYYYVMNETKEIVREVLPNFHGNVYVALLERCILGSPTPIIRKRCFQRCGLFDESLQSCQDWDMWIRLSRYYEFDFVPDILAKHYVYGDQISANLNFRIQGREKLIKKYQVDLSKYLSIFSLHSKRLGILHCLAGNKKEGRKYILNSIKLKPFQKGAYFHFVSSLLAPKLHRHIIKQRNVLTIEGVTLYY